MNVNSLRRLSRTYGMRLLAYIHEVINSYKRQMVEDATKNFDRELVIEENGK